jgi:hypothetical protein
MAGDRGATMEDAAILRLNIERYQLLQSGELGQRARQMIEHLLARAKAELNAQSAPNRAQPGLISEPGPM